MTLIIIGAIMYGFGMIAILVIPVSDFLFDKIPFQPWAAIIGGVAIVGIILLIVGVLQWGEIL